MSIVADEHEFDMKRMEENMPGISQKARAKRLREILNHEVHCLTRE